MEKFQWGPFLTITCNFQPPQIPSNGKGKRMMLLYIQSALLDGFYQWLKYTAPIEKELSESILLI